MGKTVGVILSLADKCSPVLKGIAKQFGATEQKARQTANTIAKSTKTFAKTAVGVVGAVGAVAGGIALATKKAVEYGDSIDKTSKKIGMSTKAYQQWDFIMSQNGGSVESLSGAYKGLRNNLSGVQKGSKDSIAMFKKLGVSVKDNNGKLRSQDDIFEDCVKSLQKMTNETERALLGQKLFGKGFQDLAPLIDSGAGSIEKLKKEYADLGLGMSDEDIQRAVALGDSWDKVGRTFQMVGMQLGVTLMPYVQELTNTIIKHLPEIKAGLIPALQTTGKVLGFLITHIRGVISAVAGLTVGVGALRIAILLCKTAIRATLIGSGIGIAVVLITELILHWKDLYNWVCKVGNAIKNAFSHKKPKKEDTGLEEPKEEKPKKHALGTSYFSGGLTSVNENGGEIIDLPRGSRIIPADKSDKMMNSSNVFNINLSIEGNVIGNRQFLEQVGDYLVGEIRKVVPA